MEDLNPEKVMVAVEGGEAASAAPAAQPLTEAQLLEQGMNPAEIASAKKLGLVPDAKKEASDGVAEGTRTKDGEGDARAGDGGADGKAEGKDGSASASGDGSAQAAGKDGALDDDPAKEHEKLTGYNANEKALYWTQKRERQKRQSVEVERDHAKLQLAERDRRLAESEKEREQLRQSLDTLRKAKLDGMEGEVEPAAGDGAEGDDKPLTRKDLERIESEKHEKAQKDQQDREARAHALKSIHVKWEQEAKTRYADFDEVIERTEDILKNAATLYPEPRERSRIIRKAQEMLIAVANADQFKDGEYNGTDMAYELGKLHPKFSSTAGGKQTDKTGDTNGGGQTTDEARRALENANRRGSSASVGGGSGAGRLVDANDLSWEDAARLPEGEFRKLPKAVRDRVLRESSGTA